MNVLILSLICILIFSSCAYTKDSYHKGYKDGVHEQVKEAVSQFHGGIFPYFHWVAPIVQNVRIPAHLINGALIPEHDELVIIQPGQWILTPSYPIQTQQRNRNDNNENNISSAVSITPLP